MTSPETPTFGRLLRQYRLAAGLSQEALAERAGLAPQAVGALERGDRRRPYPQTVRRLVDALGLAAAERTAFLAAVPPQEAASGMPDRTSAAAGGLALPGVPAHLTPLIGREADVAAVADLLAEGVRLLTLTGPGGVGKTRLALAVAAELQTRFVDGVAFVPLAPLADPTLVLPTVAHTLGLREGGRTDWQEALQAYLGKRKVLLVLDNLEHLLAAAPEVTDLLALCPGVAVLATSRAPLRVRSEQEWLVAPLAAPPGGSTATDVGESPAVRLFVERARAVAPGFGLTEANASAVASICRRLDGLPLALELAAVWSKLLPPGALLARLDRALPLLTGGARDLPGRQRTLRDTVAWSHDLLEADERALFRRLAPFSGGWTLDAAQVIADGGDPGGCDELGSVAVTRRPALAILDALAALADASLLVAVPNTTDADEPRFGMLETIRDYAAEQLTASGEEAKIRDRHAAYYLALAEEAGQGLAGPAQAEWLGRLGREHDNLRAALSWLLMQGQAERAAQLGWGLRWFWQMRGFLTEGRRWMERALAAGAVLSPATRSRALTVVGQLAFTQGDYEGATAALAESVQLARTSGEGALLAAALLGQGFLAAVRGEYEAAAAWAEESAHLHLADGDAHGASLARLGMAHAEVGRGDLALAGRLTDESEALARAAGAPFALAAVLNVRVMLAQLAGDAAETVPLLRESLQLSQMLGDVYALAYGLLSLGGALASLGRGESAARLFGAAEALRDVIGIPIQYAGSVAAYDQQVALLHAQLTTEALTAAWESGRALTPAEALAEALATPCL